MLPVGYLVLWSQEFSDLFKYRFEISLIQFLEVDTRLMLIYFGAISVAAGVSIYSFRCPEICKNNRNGSDYYNSIIGTANVAIVEKAVRQAAFDVLEDKRFNLKDSTLEAANPFMQSHLAKQNVQRAISSDGTLKTNLSTILHNQYQLVVHTRKIGCWSSIAFILLGWSALAIPSIEVFFLVLHKLLIPVS